MHSQPFLVETDGISRILIVDDDRIALAGLQTALAFRFPGMRIDSAHSVREALAKLDAAQYAAILTDLQMPGGSGLDLLQQIGQSNRGAPVLVMSGDLDGPTASTVLEHGACGLLTKPIDRDVLTSAITEAFRLRRANVLPAPWGTA